MDERSKFEVEQLKKRMDDAEDTLDEQENKLEQLATQVMRVWHVGIGIAAGLLLDKLGLEKIIGKLL